MTIPTVSVIVPTRDRNELLGQALASIRAVEGADLRLEIVVADNSAEHLAEPVAERFSAMYVTVAKPGAAAARNAALHAATGDFIAFLDDDDLWLPPHVRPHLRLLAEHPEFGAVIAQVVNTDGAGTHRGVAWPARLSANGDVRTEFFRFAPQIGATVVRAQIARTVGDFDETLMAGEDWDWQLRLAARCLIGFFAEPMVLFRQRPVVADMKLKWMRLGYVTTVMWRNMLRMPRAVRVSTLRAFVAHRGTFSFDFGVAARAAYAAGDRGLARTALAHSFVASPPHFAASLIRDRTVLTVLIGVTLGWAS